MVAGHLQIKNGIFYTVLSYVDEKGKRKTKWTSTGLPVKGNKKRAEAILHEARKSFAANFIPVKKEEMLFADYLDQWLEMAKSSVSTITYSSYSQMIKGIIAPYFRKKRTTLIGLQPKDLQDFYTLQLKRVKANSVIHYHVVIHRALKYAFKTDLITVNPADKIDRPKVERYVGSFYDSDEMAKLLEVVKGTKLELPVFFGAFYGLRRSEVIGLKWDAIDFKNDTITIRHTVTCCNIDGKQIMLATDTTKTRSSMRTLPLVPMFKEKLLEAKAAEERNKRLCGRSYCKDYLDYICVDEMGNLIKPEYVTAAFPVFLERKGLRKIRFHDLRHSCASLLLINGIPMKQIQEWLGHSDFSTTANIYAHLDYSSKISSAQAMMNGLKLGETSETVSCGVLS